MSILSTDIKFFKAANQNDTDGNGGVVSTTEVTTNVVNNLFPNVSHAERLAGTTRYRKIFFANDFSGELHLYNTKVWLGTLSGGGDNFQIKEGTASDVQSAADDYTDWAGSGQLAVAVSSGETTLVVDYETNSGVYDGSKLIIVEGSTDEELDVGAPVSWNGNQATITLQSATDNVYTTAATVCTFLDLGTIQPCSGEWTESSASGTYDEDTYPLTMYSQGSVEDTWTLTFSDASNFAVVGAREGSVGSGDITSDFQPPNGGSYYLKIDKDGWGGTWANGEYITFKTYEAKKGIWVKENVPAGTGSYSNNNVRMDWKGESG